MKTLLRRLFRIGPKVPEGPPEVVRAWKLISAIDAGGVPLDPRIITQIAEGLGLEVSRKARPEETIDRIRAALARTKTK